MANLCSKNKHEMVMVVPDLLVCECSATGMTANMIGAVDDARRLIERAGGFAAIRDRVHEKAAKKRQERAEERLTR